MDTVPNELEFVSKSFVKNKILRQFSNYSNLGYKKKPFQIQKLKAYELFKLICFPYYFHIFVVPGLGPLSIPQSLKIYDSVT